MVHNIWALVAVLLLGCGSPDPEGEPVVPVKGTVTLDGKPLPNGRVQFIDEERQPRREYIALIEQGAFECQLPPEISLRVEIRSYLKPENPTLDDDPYPQIISAKYNENSELTFKPTRDAANNPKFELKSQTK